MPKTILHIGESGPLVIRYFNLLGEHFDTSNHCFLCLDSDVSKVTSVRSYARKGLWLSQFISKAIHADKIILHGLFKGRLLRALCICPWLLKRCYWVVWGGDLYRDPTTNITEWLNECTRRFVIKRVGYLLTYIPGDYALAQARYKACGRMLECNMYPSNVFKPLSVATPKKNGLTILLGNSASQSNHHREALEMIRDKGLQPSRIICPLTYGDASYADEVEAFGKKLFPDSFLALREFLPVDDYLQILNQVDIAIFAHRRQQAMGNIISLIGYGKKVFIRSNGTPWQLFQSMGLRVFDLEQLEDEPISEADAKHNLRVVSEHFSEQNLVAQWKNIFSNNQ